MARIERDFGRRLPQAALFRGSAPAPLAAAKLSGLTAFTGPEIGARSRP